ncbi:DNA primase [Olsenella sp. KH3B4]|uniref:DNA primase n=1 Tax=Olsenella sp. KH3B4 TaxID=1855394 RepID=UPI0008AB020F|nr:DNA primase [Olsenella sp. KH3B4]SES94652.1 DNA primase [Olsenella sp. KH3B4]
MISDEDKERVRQATDIVQLVGETVELRQRGREFWGCCPFHHEKTPSFKVDPATGLWHCFGACSEGGDVFKYVMKRENLSFPDSIRYLADRAGIELTEDRGAVRGPRKNRLIEALTLADDYYHTMLMRGRGEGPAAARAYLAGRGFGSDVCRRWHLGYAPGRGALVAYLRGKGFSPKELIAANLAVERSGRLADWFYDRAMFPIHDEQGRTIAFGGRILRPATNAPKYLNTRDTTVFNKGKHLFAYDRAKETMAATGTAIVCEGYTDVIAMHEAGFTNAVAALGTAFRIDHIRLMERQRVSRIICMFDGDEAGQRAAERAVQFIDKTSASMVCVVLPDGQDPMEFLSSHDASAMQAELDAAVPLMDFVFTKRLAGYDLSAPGRRVKALDEMAQLLAPLKNSVLLDEYATQLADALGMDVAETKRVIREKPVKAAESEERERRREAAPRPRTAGPWQAPSAPDPEDAYVPEDYVPADAYEDGGVPVAAATAGGGSTWGGGSFSVSRMLSGDERMQVAVERELLSMLAAMPDEVRPYADRLADVMWADGRHEGMAWAMLATPEGTAPADVVAAATAVEPDAPQILSSGRVVSSPGMDAREKVAFLVDSVELYSCKRRVREIKARLRQAGDAGGEDAEALFEQATALQKRINELTKKLSAVVEQ